MSHVRSVIMMVDDNQANLTIGKNMLTTFYQVIPTPSAAKMFEALTKITPDLILLDIDMPEMNGYEAIKRLKADCRYAGIPVIFLTAKDDPESEREGFDLGAVDYIAKPFSAALLLKRIEKELSIVSREKRFLEIQTELQDHLDNMECTIQKKALEIIRLQNAVLNAVVELVEFRDKHTGGHVIRTQSYLRALIDELLRREVYIEEISEWDIDAVIAAAQLHDVGKIAVPDVILGKTSKLSSDEYDNMKTHVAVGINAIEKIIGDAENHLFLQYAMRITGTHHERWDGNGYPMGLKGQSIPLEGRLMAIADVYDALVSTRPYKTALSHAEACTIIEDGAGTQFDPVLVDIFRLIKDEFERIAYDIV